MVEFAGEPGMAVAWAQLIFNVVMSLAVLLLLRRLHRRLEAFDLEEHPTQNADPTQETTRVSD